MEMTVEKGRRTHRQNPQGTRRTHDRPRGKQKKGERGGKDDRTDTAKAAKRDGRHRKTPCLKRGNLGTPTFGLSAKDRDTRTHTTLDLHFQSWRRFKNPKPSGSNHFSILRILRILQSFSYVLGKIELCNCATQNIIVQSGECKGE